MEKHHFWIFMILGILMGLAFQGLKETSPEHARLNRLARLEALMDEGRPVYHPGDVSAHHAAKSLLPDVRVAGLEDKAADKAEEKKADEPKASATAEKKTDKKKDDKKKKKKKKDEKKDISAIPPLLPKGDDKKSDVAAAGGSPDFGPTTFAAAPIAAPTPPKEPLTADEWIAFLTANPDGDHYSKFIKSYETGSMKSDVFYPVVVDILGSKDQKLHQFAVQALGETPSETSFKYLVIVLDDQANFGQYRVKVTKYLNLYTQLEYVRHLAEVLSVNGDPKTNLEALNLIKTAVTAHSTAANSTSGAHTQGTNRVPATAVVSKYFSTLLPKLNLMATTATNHAVGVDAETTLEYVRSLVGSEAS
jgi:hypothetical protein